MAPVNWTATITRTPTAMPSMKRRKPGSQEKEGRALSKSENMYKLMRKKIILAENSV